jgi:hypothetical protein
MANSGTIANVTWHDTSHTQIRIPWKHGSRSGWTLDDCALYREWAKHTGKLAETNEPKRWKANFRCALNSLPDVKEVKFVGQSRGTSPYKVYELLEESVRKSHPRKQTKRSRRSGVGKSTTESSRTADDSLRLASGFRTYARGERTATQQQRAIYRYADDDEFSRHPLTCAADERPSTPPIADAEALFRLLSIPTSTDLQYSSLTSFQGGVIPTVVEELSTADDLTDGPESLSILESLEMENAVNSIQQYARSPSLSSSGSGSLMTDDSGIAEDTEMGELMQMEHVLFEMDVEETTGYQLLIENNPFFDDYTPLATSL